LYIIAFIIIIYLIITAFIRVKLNFWLTQPVFHIYNLKFWVNPPGLINKELPKLNKYVNLVNNKLIKVSNDTTNDSKDKMIELEQICAFIKNNYMIHSSTEYKPSVEDITSYLKCSNHPSFFNVYQEPKLLFEKGIPLAVPDKEIIGVISARPLNINLIKNKQKISFPVYYVDNLCIHPAYRKKGIAPEVIQTLYYSIVHENPKVSVCLFKREGQLNAIVPLVYYDTYCFDITQLFPEYRLPPAITVIEIGQQHLTLLTGFIREQLKRFKCSIIPDISNLIHLIKLGKLKIYGLLFNGEFSSIYVFRALELFYNKKRAIECISIISNSHLVSSDMLIAGFTITLSKINADILLIEETADSKGVVDYLKNNIGVDMKFKNPTAFFLYNYACHSIQHSEVLILY
jgi:ribosomal protein S18 acetylase RimI-like enzyme